MRLPKLDDLIDEQLKVYEHPPDEHLFVAGPPGSGKTTLAVLRAKFLADLSPPRSVLLITRNRMLAAMGRELGINQISTSTMHSHVSSHYRGVFGRNIPGFESYSYDWVTALGHYSERGAVPKLDHIVIDEGQNLPPGFFRWALRVGAKTLTVFADEDQSTDTDRSSLRDIRDAGLPDPTLLSRNHRNTPEIAKVAEHFHHEHNKLPAAIVVRAATGETPELVAIPSWDDLVGRIRTRLANRNESIGVIAWNAGNAANLHASLRKAVPESARVSVYTSDAPSGAEFGIRLLEPGITTLTGESVIGLEFECVYLQDLGRSLPCLTQEQRRRLYMLCARAKNSLFLVNGPQPLTAQQVACLPPPELVKR